MACPNQPDSAIGVLLDDPLVSGIGGAGLTVRLSCGTALVGREFEERILSERVSPVSARRSRAAGEPSATNPPS